MKKRKADQFWIPFWVDKWIFGSLRLEFTHEERAIWMDFLALGAKDDGYIRANEELGYPIQQLAGLLMIPEKSLAKAIDKFIEKKKVLFTEDKEKNRIFYIATWEKYQFSDRHKRRVEDSMSEKSDIVSEKSDAILNYNKVNNNKIKNNMYDEDFEKLWKEYPKEGRFKKDYCRKKFYALVKAGKLEDFRKTTIGYANYLRTKKEYENFDQRVMHLSTWMNNWEGEKDRYIGFEYKAKL